MSATAESPRPGVWIDTQASSLSAHSVNALYAALKDWTRKDRPQLAHIVVHPSGKPDGPSGEDPRIHIWIVTRAPKDGGFGELDQLTTWSYWTVVPEKRINDASFVAKQVVTLAAKLVRNYVQSHMILRARRQIRTRLRLPTRGDMDRDNAVMAELYGTRILRDADTAWHKEYSAEAVSAAFSDLWILLPRLPFSQIEKVLSAPG